MLGFEPMSLSKRKEINLSYILIKMSHKIINLIGISLIYECKHVNNVDLIKISTFNTKGKLGNELWMIYTI